MLSPCHLIYPALVLLLDRHLLQDGLAYIGLPVATQGLPPGVMANMKEVHHHWWDLAELENPLREYKLQGMAEFEVQARPSLSDARSG